MTEEYLTIHIYTNFDAAKIFDKTDRPSVLRSLDRLYAASCDEYSVVFVSLQYYAKKIILMSKLSQVATTLFFGIH